MCCGTAAVIGYTSAMLNDSSIQLRAPRLLNLSVYLTISRRPLAVFIVEQVALNRHVCKIFKFSKVMKSSNERC